MTRSVILNEDTPTNVRIEPCDLHKCREVFHIIMNGDRPLALLIFVLSKGKLVSEALRDICDTWYYVREYAEASPDEQSESLRRRMLVQCIVYAQKLHAQAKLKDVPF